MYNDIFSTFFTDQNNTIIDKVKNDHHSKFFSLSKWKEETWKNQGFNGIRTRDLRNTGAMFYQLNYETTHWERAQFIEFKSPVRSEMMWSIYEIIHIWTAVVDASEECSSQKIFLKHWFFQAFSFQLLKLENLLRWSFFTFIHNRSSYMNHFIYTSHQYNWQFLKSARLDDSTSAKGQSLMTGVTTTVEPELKSSSQSSKKFTTYICIIVLTLSLCKENHFLSSNCNYIKY